MNCVDDSDDSQAVSIFLKAINCEYYLFKIAIAIASNGSHVWFIAPKLIETIPTGIKFADKDILKLIRFIYLTDAIELLEHLNEAHSWMQLPVLIILHHINNYVGDDAQIAAFLMCNLLDVIRCCAKKLKCKAYLLLSCDFDSAHNNVLQSIVNMYVDKLILMQNIMELNAIINFI